MYSNNLYERIDILNPQENALTPRYLGYLGLIPFLISSLLIWLPQFHHHAVKSLTIYAAVILTFIGGVHWGIAMQSMQTAEQVENKCPHNQFIFSIVPSLLAWVAVVFLESYSLIMMSLWFVLFWWIEKLHYQQRLPKWYSKLRNHLTLTATLSIMIGWFGTL